MVLAARYPWIIAGLLAGCAPKKGETTAPEQAAPAEPVLDQCNRFIGAINAATPSLIAATEAMENVANEPSVVGDYEAAVQEAIDAMRDIDLPDKRLTELAHEYAALFERSKPLAAAVAAAGQDADALEELTEETDAIKALEDRLVDNLNAYCEAGTR